MWGGEAGANDASAQADGFAVDLDTGAVSPIPVAPIDPRSGATGVWTGTELIVCCGTGQADGFPFDTRSAAAWNPGAGTWRELAPPPASVARSYPASVWTGDVMVVVAQGPADAVYGSGRVPPDGAVADSGWRWTPGDTAWAALPDLPSEARTSLGSMAWTGSEVVVWGESTGDEGLGTGARWRPGDDRWSPMAPSPQNRVEAFDGTPGSQSVVADPESGQVVVRGLVGGDAAPPLYVYDPAADGWTETPLVAPGHHSDLRIVGGRVLVPDEAEPVVGDVPGS